MEGKRGGKDGVGKRVREGFDEEPDVFPSSTLCYSHPLAGG